MTNTIRDTIGFALTIAILMYGLPWALYIATGIKMEF